MMKIPNEVIDSPVKTKGNVKLDYAVKDVKTGEVVRTFTAWGDLFEESDCDCPAGGWDVMEGFVEGWNACVSYMKSKN